MHACSHCVGQISQNSVTQKDNYDYADIDGYCFIYNGGYYFINKVM